MLQLLARSVVINNHNDFFAVLYVGVSKCIFENSINKNIWRQISGHIHLK